MTNNRIMLAADVDTGPILTAGSLNPILSVPQQRSILPKSTSTLSNLILCTRQVASRPAHGREKVASKIGMKTSAGWAAPNCAR